MLSSCLQYPIFFPLNFQGSDPALWNQWIKLDSAAAFWNQQGSESEMKETLLVEIFLTGTWKFPFSDMQWNWKKNPTKPKKTPKPKSQHLIYNLFLLLAGNLHSNTILIKTLIIPRRQKNLKRSIMHMQYWPMRQRETFMINMVPWVCM